MTLRSLRSRITDWFARWRPVLPLFVAEVIVWIGFGALLPVIPLYLNDQGVGLATLGVIIAAWPAARLIGEPVFGWLADRTARVPLMVAGLFFSGIFLALPLAVHGALAFLILRAIAGLATSLYDPAARGVLMDATPPERHGEAFGWYGAAQMSGLLLGPAIGGLGAAAFGGIGFVFVFGGVTGVIAALAVALTVKDVPRRGAVAPCRGAASSTSRGTCHGSARRTAGASGLETAPSNQPARPTTLLNRLLVAAVIANATANYGAGTYDTIWSLFLRDKGASLGLISLTFTMFAVPVLVFGPIAGRLVDRRGALRFLLLGSTLIGLASVSYTFIVDPAWAVVIILFEATGFAMVNPALYAIVARGSPAGRSSTAQGIFGGAGTVGFVISALLAGWLATFDLRYPFYVFFVVTFVGLAITLLVGRRAILAGEPGTASRRSSRCRGRAGTLGLMTAAATLADWRDDPEAVAPTVLVLGGFLTSPPFYMRMRWRLLDRGAAEVVVAPVWLPDWLLAASRGLGPVVTRSGRALLEAGTLARASGASRGAPLLVVGHSAGGMSARLLTSPEPFEGRRFGAAGRIGAIVTLGTPHHVEPSASIGRRLGEVATAFAERVVPGAAFAPTTGYLAVTSRFVVGRADGTPRERAADRLYRGILPDPGSGAIEGDGLVPCRSALLDGAEHIVLDGIVHGQLGGAPWYGSAEAIDVWWPRALAVWHAALRARVAAASSLSREPMTRSRSAKLAGVPVQRPRRSSTPSRRARSAWRRSPRRCRPSVRGPG